MYFLLFCIFLSQCSYVKDTKASESTQKTHALTRFGEAPKYPKDFTHFNYVDSKAPKGGTIKFSKIGTFDSLNKDIVKGIFAEGLQLTSDPLMVRNPEEPFTLYGILAKEVEIAKDNSWIIFYLHKNAHFHDGSPVTAYDIEFTYKLLRDKGLPRYPQFYSRISKFEIINTHTIKLHFSLNKDGKYDPELPLIVSFLRVLSKKQLENIDFANSGLKVIMGSGPYKVDRVEPGHLICYRRNPNYWGKNLPINKGKYNFDTICIDYFKNHQSQFMAFQRGDIDIFFETDPLNWERSYGFDAVKKGFVEKVAFSHKRPVLVYTIILNMFHLPFSDRRVRKALSLAFDFKTINQIVFAGLMKQPKSLFENTYLAHKGPFKGEEKKLLEKYVKDLNLLEEMSLSSYSIASSGINGNQRENLKAADTLLKEAGFIIKNGLRINKKTGKQLSLEFMIKDQRLEKIALFYKQSLKKLGIDLNVRFIDSVQYENRVIERNFDMIFHVWANSLSPGNEQLYYFSAKNADIKGSSNYIGLKDPIAEQLALLVTLAKTSNELKARVYALDRYIMFQHYLIPLAYSSKTIFAVWKDRIGYPPIDKVVGIDVMSWAWAKQH
ncbi:MAG: extracellular solute-binding protein [Alphaproteobacteria bacterium]